MHATAASHDFPCQTCEVRDKAVCSVLTDEELRELSKITTAVELAAGRAVFYEGDENTYVFNVVAGAIRLTKLLADGRRQVTGFLFPGDFLGLSVADTYACSAETVSKTSLCRFNRQSLIKMLDQFPKLEHRLERASSELVEAQTQMVMLGQKTATERISSTLLSLMERTGRSGDHGTIIELPMVREDLADYAGVRTETVSRCFTRLREKGVIDTPDMRSVHILQPKELARFSGD
jgi:CRP/FNR family transcriptional regulator